MCGKSNQVVRASATSQAPRSWTATKGTVAFSWVAKCTAAASTREEEARGSQSHGPTQAAIMIMVVHVIGATLMHVHASSGRSTCQKRSSAQGECNGRGRGARQDASPRGDAFNSTNRIAGTLVFLCLLMCVCSLFLSGFSI